MYRLHHLKSPRFLTRRAISYWLWCPIWSPPCHVRENSFLSYIYPITSTCHLSLNLIKPLYVFKLTCYVDQSVKATSSLIQKCLNFVLSNGKRLLIAWSISLLCFLCSVFMLWRIIFEWFHTNSDEFLTKILVTLVFLKGKKDMESWFIFKDKHNTD